MGFGAAVVAAAAGAGADDLLLHAAARVARITAAPSSLITAMLT
jgi:hypothetical protein